jgi:hypothetical protein
MSEIGFIKEPPKMNGMFNSKNFNVNSNHPLIQNSQEYMFHKKFVSIHSEDRDITKYPNSSDFEIEIPEDLLNVASLRLVQWTFPSNYNTFSELNGNNSMTFRINNPYSPNANGISGNLIEKTFESLIYSSNQDFKIIIEEGFYNPQQMVTELTNKFNHVVTVRLINYFTAQSTSSTLDPDPATNALLQLEYVQALEELNAQGGYQNFIIVYNNVSQKIWFGNVCDGFLLTNETQLNKQIQTQTDNKCKTRAELPDFSEWGLPANIGLTRTNNQSVNGSSLANKDNYITLNGQIVPRFYYGDVFPGDNGYWLTPNTSLTGSEVQWVECLYKINLMGPSYIYMEIEGQNCIDETSPYNLSPFTLRTNITNGVVNSAFAKMPIPTTPISQWFDRDSLPYKYYYPPAERMRKFRIKIRYHNGRLVDFGVFNYSFVIEFTLQLPQILRSSNTITYPPNLCL